MKKLRMSFMILLATVCLPTLSQHVLTKANALPNSGDAMSKQRVTYVTPGENGMNTIWDFRDVEVLTESCPIEYAEDSASCWYAIDSNLMCSYRLHGDTLVQVACQNALTRIDYSVPIPELSYPFSYCDTLYGNFKGAGRYSGHNGISVEGTSFVEADGEGTLVISDECTLKNALRVRTLRTSSFGVARDTVAKDTVDRLLEVEESYRWYARGYRYPLFETCSKSYYRGINLLRSFKEAFRILPDSLRKLADSVNVVGERQDSCVDDTRDVITYDVVRDGRSVRIDYSLTSQATVSALVSDPMGIIYRRSSRSDKAGEGYSITFDVSGLRRGKYILYLNVNGKVYDNKLVVD